METITSVSRALQEYECAGGFASAAETDTEDTAIAARVAHVEPTEDASILPQVNEGREASPPQSVEPAGPPALVEESGAAEAVVGGEGTSPPPPVAAGAEGIETLVLDEPATIAQESTVPKMMTRATTPEIQEAEETGASLSQGTVGGEARTLELACTSWAATSGLDADSEGDEEAVMRHTLEHGMTWACRTFDELILPATSVSSLVKDSFRFYNLLKLRQLFWFCWLQTLTSSGRRRACEVCQLRAERTQLEMQLVVAQVAAAGAVASKTSARASLEVARQSTEDRAISAETTTAAAATEGGTRWRRGLRLPRLRSRSSERLQRLQRRRLREPRPL
jgi:hypothetical protein